jgi:Sap, sulfolipid-1-addressing protein
VGELVLQLLPLAIVCALSPWAIVAVILMLSSDRPSNSVAWVSGWTVSTFAIGVLIILFFGSYDFSGKGTPTTAASVIQVLLGVLLLLAAGWFWARRPARTGKLPKEPGWIMRIGKMSPVWAFLIGAFWINTTVVIAAAVDALRADISNGAAIAAFASFTLITLSVQGPLILYSYTRPKRAAIKLKRIRVWIALNQQAALAVIALVLAIWFGSQGISGLRE